MELNGSPPTTIGLPSFDGGKIFGDSMVTPPSLGKGKPSIRSNAELKRGLPFKVKGGKMGLGESENPNPDGGSGTGAPVDPAPNDCSNGFGSNSMVEHDARKRLGVCSIVGKGEGETPSGKSNKLPNFKGRVPDQRKDSSIQ
jgi:hypothetical protein